MMMGKIVIKVINVRLQPGSWDIGSLNCGQEVIWVIMVRLGFFWSIRLKWEGGKMGKTCKKVRLNLSKLCRLKHDDG